MGRPAPSVWSRSRARWVLLAVISLVTGAFVLVLGWGAVAVATSQGAVMFWAPNGSEPAGVEVRPGIVASSMVVMWRVPEGRVLTASDLRPLVGAKEIPRAIGEVIRFEAPYTSYMAHEFGVPLRWVALYVAMEPPGTGTGSVERFRIFWLSLAVDLALHAVLVMGLLVTLIAAARTARRRRRLARNHCPMCAYPLTGSGACPECGVSVGAVGVSGDVRSPAAP